MSLPTTINTTQDALDFLRGVPTEEGAVSLSLYTDAIEKLEENLIDKLPKNQWAVVFKD